MFGRRRGGKRFSLLLLEEEEDYVQDWVVSCRWPPCVSGNWQGLPALSGRIRLCTKSLFFEPDDTRIPIVRFPLACAQALEAGGGGSSAFTLATTCLTKMKANMEEVPYTFEKGTASTWIFILSYAPLASFLSVAQELYEISKLGRFERTSRLEDLVRKADDASTFDASRLVDFGERLLWEGSVIQLTPLVREHGRLVVTDQRMYFQPQHNVAGDIPVRTNPLAAIAAVARRRSSLRPLGLEVFFMDSAATTADKGGLDGEGSPSEAAAHIAGPCWDAPSAFFAFRAEVDRDRALSVMLAQPELGKIAPQMSAVAFEDRGLLLEAEGQWLHKVTLAWQHARISNFDYLLYLNIAAGRSFNDLAQWPVFPWVLSNYTTENLDLEDPQNFRDLSKPVGALNPNRLAEFKKRYRDMPQDAFLEGAVPPFLYGTHYSTPGYVMYWLVRAAPAHMLKLQNGRFDAADRLFHSIHESWESVNHSTTDVKELIPEFFLPDGDFLLNLSDLPLGCRQAGGSVGDVVLPPWAKSPEHFLSINRAALEAPYVSQHLHLWIDLIFGQKQNGQSATDADNLFYYLTYEGAVDVTGVADPIELKALEVQINEFGQCPKKLFEYHHPPRIVHPPVAMPPFPEAPVPSPHGAKSQRVKPPINGAGVVPYGPTSPCLVARGQASRGVGVGRGARSVGQTPPTGMSARGVPAPLPSLSDMFSGPSPSTEVGGAGGGGDRNDGNRALTLALVSAILAAATSDVPVDGVAAGSAAARSLPAGSTAGAREASEAASSTVGARGEWGKPWPVGGSDSLDSSNLALSQKAPEGARSAGQTQLPAWHSAFTTPDRNNRSSSPTPPDAGLPKRPSVPLPEKGGSETISQLRNSSNFGSSLLSGLLKLGRYAQPVKKNSSPDSETTSETKIETKSSTKSSIGLGMDPSTHSSGMSDKGVPPEVTRSVSGASDVQGGSTSSQAVTSYRNRSPPCWGTCLPDKMHASSSTLVQRVQLGKDPLTAVAMAQVIEGGGCTGGAAPTEHDYLYCVGYGGLLRVLKSLDPFRPLRSAHLEGDLLSLALVKPPNTQLQHHPLLLVGSHNRKVYCYSVDQGRVLGDFNAHDDGVCCVAPINSAGSEECSSSTGRFATSSWDCSVKVWNMEEGRGPWSAGVVQPEVELREGLESGVWALAAGAEGQHLIVTGTEEGVVSGWDTRRPNKPTWQTQVAQDYVGGLCLLPCGKFVAAAAADGGLSLLDLRQAGARLAHVSTPSSLRCCATDGGLVLAGSDSWDLQMWDVALMSASGTHVGKAPPAPDGLYRPWMSRSHVSAPINSIAVGMVASMGQGVGGSGGNGEGCSVSMALALDNGSLGLVMAGGGGWSQEHF